MKKLLFLLLIIPHLDFAQNIRAIALRDILDEWATSDESKLSYTNLTVVETGNQDIYETLASSYDLEKDENGRVILDKAISFNNVEWDGLEINKLNIKSLEITNSDLGTEFTIDSSSIGIINIENVVVDKIFITRNEIQNYIDLRSEKINYVWIFQNCLNEFNIKLQSSFLSLEHNFDYRLKQDLQHDYNSTTYLLDELNYIKKTLPSILSYKGSPIPEQTIKWGDSLAYDNDETIDSFIDGASLGLGLKHNIFRDQVWLTMDTRNTFIIDNVFHYLIFDELGNNFDYLKMSGNKFLIGIEFEKRLKERVFDIEWQDVANKYVLELGNYYHPAHRRVLLQSILREPLRFYKELSEDYKSSGQLRNSNEAYRLYKDIELEMLRSVYDTEGGFNNYTKWRLNQLLKIYTEHGTEPAKAIVISVYVILTFAIFYFFFPSEWDVTSKSRLLANYKDFIQKNDKGYAKPFMMMILGFGISLINALTLSLNSFTTLGFGTIPTKGLARYVCIIQGFIGWFLLSIFTVALINQVLA